MIEERTAPTETQRLRQERWNTVAGLYWAALLLYMLYSWIGAKYAESTATATPMLRYVVGALCAVALLLAVWQTIALIRTRGREGTGQTLQTHKRIVGLAILALSGVLLLVALLLAVNEGLKSFPEVSSAIVLALIGLWAGAAQLTDFMRKITPDQLLSGLTARLKLVTIGLVVLGSILAITGIVLFIRQRGTEQPWFQLFPEAGGAVFLGIILLTLAAYLFFVPRDDLTLTNLRICILVTGSAVGGIIALMTVVRMFLWQEQIFTGQLSSWQGEESWRLWLCIYVELLGLALIFGSLLLARGDIRKNALLRRLLFGFNAVFMGVMLLAVLVVLNVVVYTSYPDTFNWTQSQGFYSLSDRSKQILQAIDDKGKEVYVFALMSGGSREFMDVRNLLNNCQAYSSRFNWDHVSPERQRFRYEELAKFPKVKSDTPDFHALDVGGARGLLIVYGDPDDLKSPHEFVPEDKLSDRPEPSAQEDKKGPTVAAEFRGEALLMSKLSFLVSDQERPVVYFTQSNGELDTTNNLTREAGLAGAGQMVSYLKNQDFEVKRLFFGAPTKEAAPPLDVVYTKKKSEDPHTIPEDADVIVIAWPKSEFKSEEIDALDRYMGQGGKLVVFSIIVDERQRLIKPGLEDFLKKYGVEMQRDYIIRFVDPNRFIDPFPPIYTSAETVASSENPIARAFTKYIFFADTARTVKPMPGAGGYQAETIMNIPIGGGAALPAQAWLAETNYDGLINTKAYLATLARNNRWKEKAVDEPISIGVAVRDSSNTPRLVVYGEATMASNSPAMLPQMPPPPYKDLISGSIDWLAKRPQNIAIAPKKSNLYVLRAPVTATTRIFWMPFGLMVLGLIGLGTGVWAVRRR